MQAFVWIMRFVVGVVLLWFALKNAQEVVTIHGLLDQSWKAPLVFVVLVVFVGGVVIGLLAWIPTLVRQRRELGRLRKAAAQQAVVAAIVTPPSQDSDIHGI